MTMTHMILDRLPPCSGRGGWVRSFSRLMRGLLAVKERTFACSMGSDGVVFDGQCCALLACRAPDF
jgi:hypothetical protein